MFSHVVYQSVHGMGWSRGRVSLVQCPFWGVGYLWSQSLFGGWVSGGGGRVSRGLPSEWRPLQRAVPILLECCLVVKVFLFRFREVKMEDTTCSVCCEEFAETGDHVPRLLPCSHTMCNKCVKEISKKTFLVCVECRKKHTIPSKTKTFPQNKYILNALKALGKEGGIFRNREGPQNFQICSEPDHMRDLSLRCTTCRKDICQLCLIGSHQTHQVVDIMKENTDKLRERIDILNKQSSLYKEKLLAAKEEVQNTRIRSLEHIKQKRTEIDKLFEDMMEKLEETILVEEDVDFSIAAVDEQLLKLKSVVQKIHSSGRVNDKEVEIVENAEKNMREKATSYKYFRYEIPQDEEAQARRVCGQLLEEEAHLPKLLVTSSFTTQVKIPTRVLVSLNSTRFVDGEVHAASITVADPGFPRGRQLPKGCANLLFCSHFAENCMKMKNLGGKGGVPGAQLDRLMHYRAIGRSGHARMGTMFSETIVQ